MIETVATLREQVEGLLSDLIAFGQTLLLPWRFYQLAAIVALVGVAFIGNWYLRPRVEAWLRSREGWPKCVCAWRFTSANAFR